MSIVVLILCVKSFTIYKARGLLLGLLITLNLAFLTFFLGNVASAIADTRLINANQSNISNAYLTYVRVQKVFTCLNCLSEMCSDCAHWVFAMKFWALSW